MSKSNSPTNIGYKGQVNITVRHGDKIISKQTYKNSGGVDLFEFIAHCLGNDSSNVTCPNKIALFYAGDSVSVSDANNNIAAGYPFGKDNTTGVSTAYTRVSAFCTYTTNATFSKDTDNNNASCTLHFVVPYTALKNNPKINVIGLFNKNSTETLANKNKYCAVFLLTDTDDNTKWATIDVSTAESANLNLIIDWKMIVGNGNADAYDTTATNFGEGTTATQTTAQGKNTILEDGINGNALTKDTYEDSDVPNTDTI